MCLLAIFATLEKEWEINIQFSGWSIPTSSRKVENTGLAKTSWLM